MARNKHPEETYQKILDISYRLFQEKGYDNTSIQDIVDALGMSKGAVYHHFKSKEDILDQITTVYYDSVNWFGEVIHDSRLTGLEKLRKILALQLTDPRKLEVDHLTMTLTKNPQLLALTLNCAMFDAAPMFTSLIEEGIRDGSIQTDYPKELSETVMILLNIWVGIYTTGQEDFFHKIGFIKEITDRMGFFLINDELLAASRHYFDHIMVHMAQGISTN